MKLGVKEMCTSIQTNAMATHITEHWYIAILSAIHVLVLAQFVNGH